MISKRRVFRIARRASGLAAVRIILALVTLVFAASISVSSTTYQAEIGSALSVTNGLLAVDKGFSVASNSSSPLGTSCASPVQLGGSPGTANTDIMSGHFVYNVQVNSTSDPTVANKTFTVTLVLAASSYGPLCIEGATTPATGQTIDCKFDVGAVLPASPYAFRVIVQ